MTDSSGPERINCQVELVDGRWLSLEIPAPDREAPAYAVGCHKGGSTLLAQVTGLLGAERRPVLYLENLLWEKGLGPEHLAAGEYSRIFSMAGYIHAGIRHPHLLPLDIVMHSFTALFVRDPFDSVVSWFYSFRESHPLPSGQLLDTPSLVRSRVELLDSSLDMAVMAGGWQFLVDEWAGASALSCLGPPITVIRYEDVIHDPSLLVQTVNDALAVGCDDGRLREVALQVEPLPDVERPMSHIRWGRPGQGQERLSPSSLALVAALSQDYRRRMSYKVRFHA